MNMKKIVIALLLIILIVSDLLIMFAQKYIGEYTSLFAMISIFSGLALIIMIIINRKRCVVSTKEVNIEYDVLLRIPGEAILEKVYYFQNVMILQ